jgi:hypothetical protein
MVIECTRTRILQLIYFWELLPEHFKILFLAPDFAVAMADIFQPHSQLFGFTGLAGTNRTLDTDGRVSLQSSTINPLKVSVATYCT